MKNRKNYLQTRIRFISSHGRLRPGLSPSNTALAVGPHIGYLVVKTYNQYTYEPITVVLAKDRFNAYFNAKAKDIPLEDYKAGDKLIPYRVVAEFTGPELEGIRYEQLLPWMQRKATLSG